MSNIIDSIQISGVTYTIQGSGGGGNPTVELTQAQYDALVTAGTVQADTYYIITDAQGGDLSNYMTSAQTMSAITEATSGKVDSNVYTAYTASTDTAIQGKQDTLVSGTNIKTINNTSILGSGNITIQGGGGGGKAIEAGRGISVTTGETADTVSFDLPIFAGTGSNSIIEGSNNNKASSNNSHAEGSYTKAIGFSACHAEGSHTTANGNISHAEGEWTEANGAVSHAEGCYTKANNISEHASGQYNNSVSASTTFGDSGNTLFSVGNGLSPNNRHNAFEIRQNGDIYITSGGTDIKLQDNLGGGGSSYTAGRGIDITNDTISFSLPISAGSQSNSVKINFANNTASGWMSFAQGRNVNAQNQYQAAFGQFNSSFHTNNSFGGNNTLFAIGNGESLTTLHNALDVRDNGDIYIADTNDTSTSNYWEKPMIKLQDTITATAANTTALGSLSLVKLTQAQYDALATKDSSTLYVIIN